MSTNDSVQSSSEVVVADAEAIELMKSLEMERMKAELLEEQLRLLQLKDELRMQAMMHQLESLQSDLPEELRQRAAYQGAPEVIEEEPDNDVRAAASQRRVGYDSDEDVESGKRHRTSVAIPSSSIGGGVDDDDDLDSSDALSSDVTSAAVFAALSAAAPSASNQRRPPRSRCPSLLDATGHGGADMAALIAAMGPVIEEGMDDELIEAALEKRMAALASSSTDDAAVSAPTDMPSSSSSSDHSASQVCWFP